MLRQRGLYASVARLAAGLISTACTERLGSYRLLQWLRGVSMRDPKNARRYPARELRNLRRAETVVNTFTRYGR